MESRCQCSAALRGCWWNSDSGLWINFPVIFLEIHNETLKSKILKQDCITLAIVMIGVCLWTSRLTGNLTHGGLETELMTSGSKNTDFYLINQTTNLWIRKNWYNFMWERYSFIQGQITAHYQEWSIVWSKVAAPGTTALYGPNPNPTENSLPALPPGCTTAMCSMWSFPSKLVQSFSWCSSHTQRKNSLVMTAMVWISGDLGSSTALP